MQPEARDYLQPTFSALGLVSLALHRQQQLERGPVLSVTRARDRVRDARGLRAADHGPQPVGARGPRVLRLGEELAAEPRILQVAVGVAAPRGGGGHHRARLQRAPANSGALRAAGERLGEHKRQPVHKHRRFLVRTYTTFAHGMT